MKPTLRVLIGKVGLDGHDVGARVVAKGLANAGVEVIYKRHNKGEAAAHTAKRRLVQLVYHEKFENLDDAVKRERQLSCPQKAASL